MRLRVLTDAEIVEQLIRTVLPSTKDFILVQMSARRYVVAQLSSHTNFAATVGNRHAKNHDNYETITKPLPFHEAQQILAYVQA